MIHKTPSVIFFGTPVFAVTQLAAIHQQGFDIRAVVTAPDKPAGRGNKMQSSAVKEYAIRHNLRLLQPEKLKDEGFIHDLAALAADLFVVVAFRMLPVEIWKMPPLGTFNLHASLLPQYRGAAPINRAIMNGESVSGLSTFFINENIDTGEIILQEPMPIGKDETAGELHDRMMLAGGGLIIQTIRLIADGKPGTMVQDKMKDTGLLKSAPKIFRSDCQINWNLPASTIHNQIRGLSPSPGAYTMIQSTTGKRIDLKILKSALQEEILTDGLFQLQLDKKNASGKIALKDGYLELLVVQPAGKKTMTASEFFRGLEYSTNWSVPIHEY